MSRLPPERLPPSLALSARKEKLVLDTFDNESFHAGNRSGRPTLLTLGIAILTTVIFLTMSSSTIIAGHPLAIRNSISYEIVPGFFAQSSTWTNSTSFDFISSNFGLLDDNGDIDNSTDRWIRFTRRITHLNHHASPNEWYKVLYLARHGEGYHNTAETYYGTPAWDCYWSLQNGNGTTTWGPDALLTQTGITQALKVNKAWKTQLNSSIPIPQKFYSSPLSRAMSTLNLTWFDITPYSQPIILENLRENIGLHTCDRRQTKQQILSIYPNYIFPNATEKDELWGPMYQETSRQQIIRLRTVLDWIWFNEDSTFISFTCHSGTITAILENLGHRKFEVTTGAMIPVVVRGYLDHGGRRREGGKSTTAPTCTTDPGARPTRV